MATNKLFKTDRSNDREFGSEQKAKLARQGSATRAKKPAKTIRLLAGNLAVGAEKKVGLWGRARMRQRGVGRKPGAAPQRKSAVPEIGTDLGVRRVASARRGGGGRNVIVGSPCQRPGRRQGRYDQGEQENGEEPQGGDRRMRVITAGNAATRLTWADHWKRLEKATANFAARGAC